MTVLGHHVYTKRYDECSKYFVRNVIYKYYVYLQVDFLLSQNVNLTNFFQLKYINLYVVVA